MGSNENTPSAEEECFAVGPLTMRVLAGMLGCCRILHQVWEGGSTLSKLRTKASQAIGGRDVIYWLILAILCADLSKAREKCGWRLIDGDLDGVFFLMCHGELYHDSSGKRRPVSRRIRAALSQITFHIYSPMATSHEVNDVRWWMMLLASDMFYRSMTPGNYIEVRDQEMARSRFETAMKVAREEHQLTDRERRMLRQMGQAMADSLIEHATYNQKK